jgi:hypothetical protein
MDALPTSSQWALEGELRCHSVSETLRYLAWCADWADEQELRRAAYPGDGRFAPADSVA